ncbi:MAG: OmpA family protein [Cryomorphaceae bacterium]|nr:OmpA family protein [Cryomorphaceae bacterium]
MRSIYVLTVCLFYLCTANAKTTTSEISLRFDTDIDQLDAANQKKLKEFLSTFTVDDDLTIVVRGHADKRGSTSYNLDLSERRASTVTSILTGEGFCDIGIVTEAFGEQKPMNGDRQNLTDNRRVDVVIQKHDIESEAELLEILGSNNDLKKEIDLTQENVVKSNRGTIVGIPANCFLDANGQPVENAIINITEALSYQDFLAEGLTTMSEGKMLESGGMLKIEAFSNTGEALTLDPNNTITISLPTDFKKQGMTLFVSETGADWTDTKTSTVEVSTNYPERPIFPNFRSFVPSFTAAPKPTRPGIRMRPKMPKEVDDSKYEVDFEWYEIFGRKKIIAQNQANKERAYQRYERSMARYHSKLEKFIADSLAQPEKHKAYQEALMAWRTETTTDSLYFMEQIYLPYVKKREIEINLLYTDYETKLSAWRDSCAAIRNAKLAMAMETGIWDIDLINSYTFNSSSLGWINCDRFYAEPALAKIQLHIDAPIDNQVVLVFDKINSLLPCSQQERGYTSPLIPKKQNAVAIAYSVKNGQIMLDQAKFTGQPRLKLKPVPVSLNEFREALHVNS